MKTNQLICKIAAAVGGRNEIVLMAYAAAIHEGKPASQIIRSMQDVIADNEPVMIDLLGGGLCQQIRDHRTAGQKFWYFVHNAICHPLLCTGWAWCDRFHDWTAQKM